MGWTVGFNGRNDEIRDNVTRMRREWEAQHSALATVRRFNAIMSTKGNRVYLNSHRALKSANACSRLAA